MKTVSAPESTKLVCNFDVTTTPMKWHMYMYTQIRNTSIVYIYMHIHSKGAQHCEKKGVLKRLPMETYV